MTTLSQNFQLPALLLDGACPAPTKKALAELQKNPSGDVVLNLLPHPPFFRQQGLLLPTIP